MIINKNLSYWIDHKRWTKILATLQYSCMSLTILKETNIVRNHLILGVFIFIVLTQNLCELYSGSTRLPHHLDRNKSKHNKAKYLLELGIRTTNHEHTYLGITLSFEVISKLPPGVETPAVLDPIVSPLCNWIISSPKLAEMTGSSIMTTKLVLLNVSLMTGLFGTNSLIASKLDSDLKAFKIITLTWIIFGLIMSTTIIKITNLRNNYYYSF